MPEPYGLLGVQAGASEAEVRAAFRRAAKKCHPDMNAGDRAGERRLRRLIAARDFLLSPGQHFSNRKAAGHPLKLGAPNDRRAPLFAGTFTGAGFLLFLLLILRPPVLFSATSGPFQTSIIDSPIPDAGSAEVKAIRDFREFAGTNSAKPGKVVTDGAARDKTSAPGSVFRHAPRSKRAVTGAAAAMTKTWRRLAWTLGGS